MQPFDDGVIALCFGPVGRLVLWLAQWDPAGMDFPCSLDTILPAEHYRYLCIKTLQTLVKTVRVDPEVMTELGRHVLQRPPGDMATATAQAQDMLHACNIPRRYKRHRAACALTKRDPPPPLCAGCPKKE